MRDDLKKAQSRSRIGTRVLSATLMFMGLAWVIFLMITTLDDPRQLINIDPIELIIASTLLGLSMMTNWLIFHSFLDPGLTYSSSILASLRLYSSGQLLRYLPGRVWGIIYQISTTRGKISAGRITRANIDLMLFSVSGSAAIALIILAVWLKPFKPLLLAVGLLILTMQALTFLGGSDWLIHRLAKCLPKRISLLILSLSAHPLRISRYLALQFIFGVSWIVYLFAWSRLALVFPHYSDVDFVSIALFYSLASIAGILSIITPAGLGVREAAFVILAANVAGTQVLAFIAIFSRIWLMCIETVVFVAVNFPLLIGFKQK